MYIAMNRFRIVAGREEEFVEMWRKRESHLDKVPGFREFHLLRGSGDDEATLFASHVIWESKQAFEGWTKSEEFRKAHAGARTSMGFMTGPPNFEGFDVVL